MAHNGVSPALPLLHKKPNRGWRSHRPWRGCLYKQPPTMRGTNRRNNRLDHHSANKPTRLRLGRRVTSVSWERKVFLGKGPYHTREPAGTFVEGTLMRQVLTRRATVCQSLAKNK